MTVAPSLQFVVLVHGTWGRNSLWCNDDDSAVSRALKHRLGDRITIVRFSWSGRNSHDERIKSAWSLSKVLWGLCHTNAGSLPIHIIAHSHGGNVAMHAVRMLTDRNTKLRVGSLCMIGTPFFDIHQEDTGEFQWILTTLRLGPIMAFPICAVVAYTPWWTLQFMHFSLRWHSLTSTAFATWLCAALSVCSVYVAVRLFLLLVRPGLADRLRGLIAHGAKSIVEMRAMELDAHVLSIRTNKDEALRMLALASAFVRFMRSMFNSGFAAVIAAISVGTSICVTSLYGPETVDGRIMQCALFSVVGFGVLTILPLLVMTALSVVMLYVCHGISPCCAFHIWSHRLTVVGFGKHAKSYVATIGLIRLLRWSAHKWWLSSAWDKVKIWRLRGLRHSFLMEDVQVADFVARWIRQRIQ